MRPMLKLSTRAALAIAVALAALAVVLWHSDPVAPGEQLWQDGVSRLECEVKGYPCTWPEVSPEAAVRTDQVGQIAAELLRLTQDPFAVADLLAEVVEFAELDADVHALRFRLPGARPAWVSLPHDHGEPADEVAALVHLPTPAPPGARGPSARVSDWAAAGIAALFPAVHAQASSTAGGSPGVNTSQPGSGKKALILSPYHYEMGGEAPAIYQRFSRARDYQAAAGGAVEFYANLNPHNTPNDPADQQTLGAQGQSTLIQFFRWSQYNFVYVATHGLSYCPTYDKDSDLLTVRRAPSSARDALVAAGKCETRIWVQDYPNGAAGLQKAHAERAYLARPGVDPHYDTVFEQDPQLSAADARFCLTQRSPDARVPGTGRPCFFERNLPTEIVVTAEFFRRQYPGGLSDVVIFLAACEGLKVKDVANALAPPGTRNTAVFGYTELVSNYFARPMGIRAADAFLDGGYHHRTVEGLLRQEAAKLAKDRSSGVRGTGHASDFDSVLRGRGRPTGRVVSGAVEDASTNPTHARDIVLLIDPLTGAELKDGGSVVVRESPDGDGDRLDINPELMGVAPDQEPPRTRLQVRVAGEPVPDETYLPDRWIRDGVYRYAGTVSLGRTHVEGEVVDLEVRADLGGGSETRWVYEDIALIANPCEFTATVAGNSRRGTVTGTSARFSTRGQATILGGAGTPEALEDLMALAGRLRGPAGLREEVGQRMQPGAAPRRDEHGWTAGGSVGISLVETRPGGIGPAPGGLATAFKLDVLSRTSIAPGFTGTLPVHTLVLHTGEFASEGGGPMLYRWTPGMRGSVQLHVSRFDGSRLDGSVTAELEGVTALMTLGGGKPRVQVQADFRAGAFNPLQFENVCAFGPFE